MRPAGGPLLIVNGSLNPVSLRQTRWAVEHGFRGVAATADDVRGSSARAADQLCRHLEAGGDTVLHTAAAGGDAEVNLDRPEGGSVARALGRIASDALGRLSGDVPVTLCVFGGDTAWHVLSACGCTRLETREYLGEGLSAAVPPAAAPFVAVVTKSGGFGADTVAEQLRRYARPQSS
jgi:uncharacterized protein YgbK (DUF1537 family)